MKLSAGLALANRSMLRNPLRAFFMMQLPARRPPGSEHDPLR